MDYLSRYQNGEQVAVWQELIALGEAIREEPLYSQAEAVVRETMRRVKHNVEILIERLKTLDYKFVEYIKPLTPASPQTLKDITSLEQKIGFIPLSLRIFYEEVGQVSLVGSDPKLSEYAPAVASPKETLQFFLEGLGASPEELAQDNISMFQNLAQTLEEVTKNAAENTPNPKVDQFKAFIDQIYKSMREPRTLPAGQVKLDVYSDPLVVECSIIEYGGDPTLYILEDYEDDGETPAVLYTLEFAPDPVHKANYSGGGPSEIRFPDPAIDAKIIGDEDYGYFVEYLRECFEWGGFLGFKHSKQPPMAEIDFLKKDLLPI